MVSETLCIVLCIACFIFGNHLSYLVYLLIEFFGGKHNE